MFYWTNLPDIMLDIKKDCSGTSESYRTLLLKLIAMADSAILHPDRLVHDSLVIKKETI